jgi:hypothetical protein
MWIYYNKKGTNMKFLWLFLKESYNKFSYKLNNEVFHGKVFFASSLLIALTCAIFTNNFIVFSISFFISALIVKNLRDISLLFFSSLFIVILIATINMITSTTIKEKIVKSPIDITYKGKTFEVRKKCKKFVLFKINNARFLRNFNYMSTSCVNYKNIPVIEKIELK